MRDDRHKWPAIPGTGRPDLVREGISLRLVTAPRQTVISGAVSDCLALCGLSAAIGGGPDMAQGQTYCLRQRRDRILVVGGPDIADGWHSDLNVAVSDMTSAYSVIEMAGERVEQIIRTGTEFDGMQRSASTSRLWHGYGVLLYRYGRDDQFRMHVRSPLLDPVWDMLERQINVLSGLWAEEAASGRSAGQTEPTRFPCREAS
ncbi:hypothetical protein [Pacificoceanicola onchidii]|uniref:hypothetical protein n=1 Tax=Pacificoceanicola onchidii TaxID=2562685 RepID=UPI0010A559BB|nr:hypothetical protein [Pacificoceanicola onchidii]